MPDVVALADLVALVGSGGSFAAMRAAVPDGASAPLVAGALGLLGPSGAALAARTVGNGQAEAASGWASLVSAAAAGRPPAATVTPGSDRLSVAVVEGVRRGGSAVPWASTRRAGQLLARDRQALVRAAVLAATGGRPDRVGWPTAARLIPQALRTEPPLAVPLDDGLWVGNLPGVPVALDGGCDAVVSLCRIGTEDVPDGIEVAEFRLIDDRSAAANPNVGFVLSDAADTVEVLIAEGRTVFLHCHGGRSRSASVAALLLARRHGLSAAGAYQRVRAVLPEATDDRFGRAVAHLLS